MFDLAFFVENNCLQKMKTKHQSNNRKKMSQSVNRLTTTECHLDKILTQIQASLFLPKKKPNSMQFKYLNIHSEKYQKSVEVFVLFLFCFLTMSEQRRSFFHTDVTKPEFYKGKDRYIQLHKPVKIFEQQQNTLNKVKRQKLKANVWGKIAPHMTKRSNFSIT